VIGSMNTARFLDDSAVLPDGQVLAAGGLNGLDTNPAGTACQSTYSLGWCG
jgi:hypothetical protein